MKVLACCFLIMVAAHAKTLQLKDLPAPAQKAIQEQLKGGEIKTISSETEKGVKQFEVESVLNGKRRDFNVDTNGKLVTLEEEVDIDTIPATAKKAILDKVGAKGRLLMVETVTENGTTSYEASYQTEGGKKRTVAVK